MSMDLFIFGAGYSGRAIAREALARGAVVSGTTRSHEKAEGLRMEGVRPFLFDGTGLSAEIAETLRGVTHLVVSIAPDHGMRQSSPSSAPSGHLLPVNGEKEAGRGVAASPSLRSRGEGGRRPDEGRAQREKDDAPVPVPSDPVIAAAGGAICHSMPKLRWIGYLSTVGVYGDHGGGWVNESSECRPVSLRSRMRLEAERGWRELAAGLSLPLAILRLSGIYGPGRNGLVNLAQGTARRIVKPGQVFNRIHVDDIAGATLMLAERQKGGVFNVTDDEPAPPQDVVAYAASLMGIEPPPEIAFEAAEMTPMARSFYGENKRVSNARLKAEGYAFRFPDYRAALDHLWSSGAWRGRPQGADARSKIRH